ncbi:MAG TPA: DUF4115 domain-containing protein [Streptosporangiaceae bacterium]
MIAVAAVVLAIALLVVGGVALWGALTSAPAKPGPGASRADPPAVSGAASSKPRPAASSTSTTDALIVRCRAPRCGVFISSVPDGDILFNGTLKQGDERHADEPRMALVVSNAGAVDVFINGRLAPKGPPGKRKTYTIVKS